MYFKNVKKGDEVFGLVFGHGTVVDVNQNGFYTMMILFDNGDEVPYTSEGIPGWGNFDYQTVYFKSDIDIEKLDFSTVDTLATPKKIIKWKLKAKLEVKCPSGLWADAGKCKTNYIESLFEDEKFWMFRKIN